jgi:hypothetical protein
MNKFFVIRKDGTLAAAQSSLGGAMDYMGLGRLLYMGTPTEATAIMRTLGRTSEVPDEGAGALLAIGLDASEGREL